MWKRQYCCSQLFKDNFSGGHFGEFVVLFVDILDLRHRDAKKTALVLIEGGVFEMHRACKTQRMVVVVTNGKLFEIFFDVALNGTLGNTELLSEFPDGHLLPGIKDSQLS